MTPRGFCAALAAEGHDAYLEVHGGPGSCPLPTGNLPDGRGWIISDEADMGFVKPDEPMPARLVLVFYQAAAENPLGLPFNEPVALLAGGSGEAAAVIRRTAVRDWAGLEPALIACDTVPASPPMPEDMTATGGAPMFGKRTRTYLRRVREAAAAVIAPWRTGTCPECGQMVPGAGLIPTSDGTAAHVVIRGAVVLGCEGFLVVDPAAIGLDRGQWQDWRLEAGPSAACISLDPGGTYQVTLFGAHAGGPVPTYPAALALLRKAVAGPGMAAAIKQAGGLRVFYVSHATSLSVEFPLPLAEVQELWDRPIRPEDEAWFAALPPHIGIEALCLLCGGTFSPHGPDDMTHGQRAGGQPCGGPGVPLGCWG